MDVISFQIQVLMEEIAKKKQFVCINEKRLHIWNNVIITDGFTVRIQIMWNVIFKAKFSLKMKLNLAFTLNV